MQYMQQELGRARKGKAGGDGGPGQIGWVAFDHYASRPTVELARPDAQAGPADAEGRRRSAAADARRCAERGADRDEPGRRTGPETAGRPSCTSSGLLPSPPSEQSAAGRVEVALDEATGAAREYLKFASWSRQTRHRAPARQFLIVELSVALESLIQATTQ